MRFMSTMKMSITSKFRLLLCLMFCLAAISGVQAQASKKGDQMKLATTIAKGTFEVKVTPQAADSGVDALIGRLLMTKQYSGDLTGTSNGQMLGTQSEAVSGSGGYVAMERIIGTLNGRKGSFILQHAGTMQGGKYEMDVSVVPDSGTDELKGISGKLKIIIEGSKHLYEFDYSIPQSK